MLTDPRFVKASYTLFAVAVLAALLKLDGTWDAKPFILRMVPATPVAKATEPGLKEDTRGEPLNLPKGRSTIAGRMLAVIDVRSKEGDGDVPVFYRPSSGEVRNSGSEPICDDLGDFPESSRAVFPLPKDYFNSYDDTWGAPRPQGGHEGTDLMSPIGTPEFAITDGTIVPVSGANKNGWNRLGGYTVMLEAAYDVGPIKKGDLFYYAHMDREGTLPIGTEVRSGQQIGVVGDTGDGREVTRGQFPPHLHLGWYDTSPASDRTYLESGAMNPYPLLSWLEENGGTVSGGTNAAYCEAPQEELVPSAGADSWPVTDSPGASPDLDTASSHDARPLLADKARLHDHSLKRAGRSREKDEQRRFGGRIGVTDERANSGSAGAPEGYDGTGDGGETSEQSKDGPAAGEDRASVRDASLRTKVRETGRVLLPSSRSRLGRTLRASYGPSPADVLRKEENSKEKKTAKKNRGGREHSKDHDERTVDAQDKKKQRKPSAEPSNPRKAEEGRAAPKEGTMLAPSQPVPEERDVASVPEESSKPRSLRSLAAE